MRAIQKGDVSQQTFNESLHIDVSNQLCIVPVVIKGKTYRFLFDTGAPFSISDEIQAEFNYKRLHKSWFTDSDKNRSSLDIVRVDSIHIGSIVFTNQTAFIADYKKNVVLKCLNIDGIVGSNLMRHCNWTIDMQNQVLQLSKGEQPLKQDGVITIPFTTDGQYDINLGIKLGDTELSGVKLDYGSNGSLSLPKSAFQVLKDKEFTSTVTQSGYIQGGLFGVRTPLQSEMAKVDSLWIEDLCVPSTIIRSNKNGLIGGKILSNYIVYINWDNQTLSFAKQLHEYSFDESFGFKLGLTDKVVVQSVTDHSSAQKQGLKPDMEVVKIDHLNFAETHTLCDYIHYFKQERKSIRVEYKTLDGQTKEMTLTKQSPFK